MITGLVREGNPVEVTLLSRHQLMDMERVLPEVTGLAHPERQVDMDLLRREDTDPVRREVIRLHRVCLIILFRPLW